jgi:hypothetical protein
LSKTLSNKTKEIFKKIRKMTSNPGYDCKNRETVLNQETLRSMTSIREEVDYLFLEKKFLDTSTLMILKQQDVYEAECVCTCVDPQHAAYTSITYQKKKTNRQTDRERRTSMAPIGDKNPLKTQQTYINSKVIKPIKHPKNTLKP